MSFGISGIGGIVENFKTTLTEIWGGSTGNTPPGKGDLTLFKAEFGGSLDLDLAKWTGNTKAPNTVKYGFLAMDLAQINSGTSNFKAQFFLQIPPQAIQQKELFSTNVTATRKGVLVESEGVVFKDIVIKGTTGVFPGQRGSTTTPIPGKSITDAPSGPQGVDSKTGLSRKPGVDIQSGYAEFLELRQFFLKYAKRKVDSNGNLFLVFVNEKDSQSLIVEPLEFTMNRSAKSPLTYEYTIVLKCIGTLDQMFKRPEEQASDSGLGFLTDLGNVMGNVSARISQARATINAGRQTLERVSQAIDQTFIGPLRQLELATADLADGLGTVLSLPSILYNNASSAILGIAENIKATGNAIENFSLQTNRGEGLVTGGSLPTTTTTTTVAITNKPVTSFNAAGGQSLNVTSVEDYNQAISVQNRIETDARIPVPRSFVETLSTEVDTITNNLVDLFNINSDEYNEIVNHTQTIIPNPLKVTSDEEFLLLGAMAEVKTAINLVLGTNDAFETEPEEYFEQAENQFQNIVEIPTPTTVREITIQQNDTLERISQRELGDANRWLEIVVLNNLKAPYISTERSTGVKAPGDKLLIGS